MKKGHELSYQKYRNLKVLDGGETTMKVWLGYISLCHWEAYGSQWTAKMNSLYTEWTLWITSYDMLSGSEGLVLAMSPTMRK